MKMKHYLEGAIKKFEDLCDTINHYLELERNLKPIRFVAPLGWKIPEQLKRIVVPSRTRSSCPAPLGSSPILEFNTLLEFTRIISKEEKEELLKLCEDKFYQGAVIALYEQSLKHSELLGLYRKATALSLECKEIYRILKPELGLNYETEDLVCPRYLRILPHNEPPKFLITIMEIMEKLKDLRARERFLEMQSPGAGGKGEQSGKLATIQQGVKLAMITTGERMVYWEGEEQGNLTDKPYQLLYVLALNAGELVPYAKVKWLVESDSEGLAKALSRHIGTIKARIPPLQNIIRNEEEIGYILTLRKDEVQVIGKMSEVDTLLDLNP
ncbi:MAG: hypothetical protein QMD05_10520 [Candidatus Brocadiaceae bacterium]|nr:hypothetical protein [Candidatus Brocadiaceae bacterium]